MTARLTGTLLADAQARWTAGAQPRALVTVLLSTGQGLPCTATQDLGTGYAAHLAADLKARRLHKGAAITVVCDGLHVRTDHGHAGLVGLGAVAIVEHLPPQPAHDPERTPTPAEVHHA
jgi:hypothetical protein